MQAPMTSESVKHFEDAHSSYRFVKLAQTISIIFGPAWWLDLDDYLKAALEKIKITLFDIESLLGLVIEITPEQKNIVVRFMTILAIIFTFWRISLSRKVKTTAREAASEKQMVTYGEDDFF